jgi:hypothetical protein
VSKYYDIFNGDADGICALHQLRLVEPRQATAITGVKRDIELLERVPAEAGDQITVLDISLKSNAKALQRLLNQGVACDYFDHHQTGDIPNHPRLRTFLDMSSQMCTSLIVDRHLQGRYRAWAVVAAFGDNLVAAALQAAQTLDMSRLELAQLHDLGNCMNYNAYGDSVEDLHYAPTDLYEAICPYENPLEFIIEEPVFAVLKSAHREDLERAQDLQPQWSQEDKAAIFVLPDEAWSRRINGVWANALAQQSAHRAHAVLVTTGQTFRVSVRAPLINPHGAYAVCAQFAGGGGRESAAGINALPVSEWSSFVKAFSKAYG